ncbi:MAG TPA: 3-hydroxyacyl-CoA dehydrogenase NAD-binding domain-containing protein, partial [Chitinophagaceae bacterium]
MEISTVCVCGAGTMGTGIAQVFAGAGFDTIVYDGSDAALKRSAEAIGNSLARLVSKEKITVQQKDDILSRTRFTDRLVECKAPLYVEAIIEDLEEKLRLFSAIAAQATERFVIATNTSSLSVTELARGCSDPASIAGLHFFNPAPVMKLVEVVTTEFLQPATIDLLVNIARQCGKSPVVCKDSPGFIVNRVARPYYIEALRIAEEKDADFETIDSLMESIGFKLGPFRLMDLIGNDINFAVSSQVYEQLGAPERLKPSWIQEE